MVKNKSTETIKRIPAKKYYGVRQEAWYGIFTFQVGKIFGLIDEKQTSLNDAFKPDKVEIFLLKDVTKIFKKYCQGKAPLAKFKPFIVRVSGNKGIICDMSLAIKASMAFGVCDFKTTEKVITI